MSKRKVKLKPKNSILSKSEMTNTLYHVIKFYTIIFTNGDTIESGLQEAAEKHEVGLCEGCKELFN